ncbi:rod shape-determining protein MreC [Patescibacteria group bacterium]|nr:rod shape-determining protein MreC [Patescibacteria group bacterium]
MIKKIIFLIIIVLFFFIFLFKGENVFYFLLSPLQRFFSFSLVQNNLDNNICDEKTQIKIFQNENQILRKHLNFLEKSKDKFILTNVIGRKIGVDSNWTLLDKGKNDGVINGLAVVDARGFLIGKIYKTTDYYSFLMPIFDYRSLISADILSNVNDNEQTNNIVSGIIKGQYESTIKIEYVPSNKKVNIDDFIITSGLQENIRRGIIIGKIDAINENTSTIFKDIIIKSFFNKNFRIASIILPK